MKKINTIIVYVLARKITLGVIIALLSATTFIRGASSRDVLDAYTDATGGIAVYNQVKTRLTVVKTSIKGSGIVITVTTLQAKPDKAHITTESPVTGKIESGYDGKIAWQNSPVTGAQIKHGVEKADLRNAATMDRFVYWENAYQKVIIAGEEQLEGTPCYKLVATPKDGGNEQTLYFDQKSKLLVKMATKIQNAMGVIPMETFFGEYRSIDGIQLPHKIRTVLPQLGREMQSEVTSCKNNIDLPKDAFKIPQEVTSLIK